MQPIRVLCALVALACIVSAQLSYINITIPYLLPESMDFVSGTYILGSLGMGGAFSANPSTGAVQRYFFQGSEMNQTSGVQYDNKGGRNRILMCSVTLANGAPAGRAGGVVAIDLSSGSPTFQAFYDTSGVGPSVPNRFCNDIITDEAGNIYATDSFGSQIWKITNGVVSQLIHDNRWDEANFALDGIEMTRDGKLIVSHLSHSELWLVTTTGTITATKINVLGNYATSNPDGIYFGPHGCLYTVGNNKVYRLASDSGWVNATVLETVTVTCFFPTAIVWNADAGAYFVSCVHGFDAGPYAIELIQFATAESDELCHTVTSSATSAGFTLLTVMMVIALFILM
jgi:hypothetical protein